jgi:hypothetical protein
MSLNKRTKMNTEIVENEEKEEEAQEKEQERLENEKKG